MFLYRVLSGKRNFFSELNVFRFRLVHNVVEHREESCQYPPIIDMSEEGQKRHFRQLWYDSIKAMPSVEEKLFELAVQQLKNLKTYNMSAVSPTYNGVNFQSYITRTHVVDGLPQQLTNINISKELDEMRDTFCEILLNYYANIWEENKHKNVSDFIAEKDAGSRLVSDLISQCYKKLAGRNEYIVHSTIQQKPRIYSFWWHGGFGSDTAELHERNICFQYEDYGTLAIRVKHPLLPILGMDDPLCSTPEVIDFKYHPDIFRIPTDDTKALASIPGFWPGDPREFPFLLVLTTDKLQSLTSRIQKFSLKKIETGTAVMSSFAWLNAVATYQGFTPYHDITYPIVTQTILTNGQDWKFFVYQLNTIAFHEDVDNKNRRNICWCSDRLRLFDTIEDGQVKGINEEVFKMLLQFLHNAPQIRDNVDLKPYLRTDTRDVDEIVNLRYLVRKKYSRMPEKMAHLDEVPTWVKIYKQHPDAPPTPFIRLE